MSYHNNVEGQDSQNCRLATRANAPERPLCHVYKGCKLRNCAVTVIKEPMMQRQIVVVIGRHSGSHSCGYVIGPVSVSRYTARLRAIGADLGTGH